MDLAGQHRFRAQTIMAREDVSELRRKVTMYKGDDETFALFRMKARHNIVDIVTCAVSDKPYPRNISNWIKKWEVDTPGGIGEVIKELVVIIEREAIELRGVRSK